MENLYVKEGIRPVTSHVIQSSGRAVRQPPLSEILQTYRDRSNPAFPEFSSPQVIQCWLPLRILVTVGKYVAKIVVCYFAGKIGEYVLGSLGESMAGRIGAYAREADAGAGGQENRETRIENYRLGGRMVGMLLGELAAAGIGAEVARIIPPRMVGPKAYQILRTLDLNGMWKNLCFALGGIGLREGLSALEAVSFSTQGRDRAIREEIFNRYGVSIDPEIGGIMLKQISAALKVLPPHYLLKEIKRGNSDAAASAYDYETQTIEINHPLGRDRADFLYAYMHKGSPWQRVLMDQGFRQGLEKVDFRSRADGFYPRHTMAGISDANSREKLLKWTLRHEIGHATDHGMNWEKRKEWSQDVCGGWKKYEGENGWMVAFGEYEKGGGTLSKDQFKEQGNNALYTFDDGGPLVACSPARIFQKDEYDVWCSYLKSARQHAVSNYQFASAEEWFAEAYAAYFNPAGNYRSRKTLGESICNYFATFLGPTNEDKALAAPDYATPHAHPETGAFSDH